MNTLATLEWQVTVSFVLLLVVAGLALVDGIWWHLVVYRLYARPESRREHHLHTVRAFLFPVIVTLLYVQRWGGALLWIGALAVGADVVVQAMDMWVEPESRRQLGGVSPAESVLHGVLVVLGTASLTLNLGARRAQEWALGATLAREGFGTVPTWLAGVVVVGAVAVAGLHVLLSMAGAPGRSGVFIWRSSSERH